MRLDGPESGNVEDRRGQGGGGFGGGFGGGSGIRIGGGIGGVVIVLIGLFFGVDLTGLMDDGSAPPQRPPSYQQDAPRGEAGRGEAGREAGRAAGQDDPGRRFVGQVLRETELVWQQQFQRMGRPYREPQLVLFSGSTRSGCGAAQAQVGPFYCPEDQRVYIDLDFMAQLQSRLGARGDFAAAYIIAHEVGHHVQNQLGILDRAQAARGDEARGNQIQVRIELQADCFAGVWANNAQRQRNILEDGDIEEGLNAAAAVGDDRLQRSAGRAVQPESFTHGSSAQRVRWFRRGLQSGDPGSCDTFGAGQI